MAGVVFPFEAQSADVIKAHFTHVLKEKRDRYNRMLSAARLDEPAQKRAIHATTNPHLDGERILLSEKAVCEIHRLMTMRRITTAENAIVRGKTILLHELRKARTGGTILEPTRRGDWESMVKKLPLPSGRFGVPLGDLTLNEKNDRLGKILSDVKKILERYAGHPVPDEARQDVIRRYMGILGSEVDATINDMDKSLPMPYDLSVQKLMEYGIALNDLIFKCHIPIGELKDAQIVMDIEDLIALGFTPRFLGDDMSLFSVDDFVSLFGGSYQMLKNKFGTILSELPKNAFSARQLRLLQFNFGDEYGTIDDIRRMNLDVHALVELGMTPSILASQFQMTDTDDLSKKLGWRSSDIRAFVEKTGDLEPIL